MRWLLLCLLLAVPAQATTALLLDAPAQARLSTAVVVATVGESTVSLHPDYKRPVTRTRVSVDEALFGGAPKNLVVEQFGGTLAGATLAVPGDARLVAGERVVLFLRQVDGGWFLTALEQSAWGIDGDRLSRPSTAHYTQRAPDGRLVEAPDQPSLSLASLRLQLKALSP